MPFISEDYARQVQRAKQIAFGLLLKTDDGGDPPAWARMWGGVGSFAIDADLIDTQGGVYSGVGELIDLPVLQQLINGLAERIEFTLSGVRAETLALIGSEAESVRDAPAHVWMRPLGGDLQPLGPPIWVWEGKADVLRVKRSGQLAAATRSVTVSVGSIFTGRRRPGFRNFTGPDQRRRSADDAHCDRAGLYNAGTTRKWP